MAQKILVGVLALAIVAVIGFSLLDAAQPAGDVQPAVTDNPIPAPTTAAAAPANTATSAPAHAAGTQRSDSATAGTPQPAAEGAVGDSWAATGTISALDDFGFTLETPQGSYYVELGPPSYWQAQGVTLAVGAVVTVDGYYNGEQVHARIVTAGDAQIVIRNENGQPMWAGGSENSAGSAGSAGTPSGSGTAQGQVQVAPEDWVTLTGSISRVSNGNVTLTLDDGSSVVLQMGQREFWQSQGVTLNVGDSVEVLGFWSNGQFMAADILKVATGEHIILRDPNGRQLWGGPGRNGQRRGQTDATAAPGQGG